MKQVECHMKSAEHKLNEGKRPFLKLSEYGKKLVLLD